jgi:hypothetical protein
MRRVSLLPFRNDWTLRQREAVVALECMVANRGDWRPGDVERIPITNSHMAWWLRKTFAHACGIDYARECLRDLVALGLIRDSGLALLPRKQPRTKPGSSFWWRLWEIVPITSARALARLGGSAAPVSLYRWLLRQGVIRKKSVPSKGSVQWAFAHSGPP